MQNPFYGVLPASAGTLGLPTVTRSQLLRPYAQYQNIGNSAPDVGNSTYHSLQMRMEKRFSSGGTITGSYTWAKLLSDTDTLSSWLEAGHSVGGVQNFNNLRLEKSLRQVSMRRSASQSVTSTTCLSGKERNSWAASKESAISCFPDRPSMA